MRTTLATLLALAAGSRVAAAVPAVRCDDLATAELTIDGLLDDWPTQVRARAGAPPDGAIALRCAWDGSALAIALDITDDRVVRVRGNGHQDRVDVTLHAGDRPLMMTVLPGTAIAKTRLIGVPAKAAIADSLQPHGFSIEAVISAAAIRGLTESTPTIEFGIDFHDVDQATGGDNAEVSLAAIVELGDRKDLLEDLLRATRLKRADITLDVLADLDPDRKGKERVVAGGAVIGVLTDRFAFVTLPVARPADVRRVELIPLGPGGLQVISAVITQTGNGGSRDLLMLWTVWSGQLQRLAMIEVRKQLAGKQLEARWHVVPATGTGKAKRPPELRVEPQPAVGWTAETWNEVPASDADPIVLPWDPDRAGVAYVLTGAEVMRRDLPRPAPPRKRR